jgi:hypothetical protein
MMTKNKPKEKPTQNPDESQPDSLLEPNQPPLDFCCQPNGCLVVILASGQKVRFDPGQIPPEFQNLILRK